MEFNFRLLEAKDVKGGRVAAVCRQFTHIDLHLFVEFLSSGGDVSGEKNCKRNKVEIK